MLKVWGRKSSSNVQALMWCIGELGLAYERIDAGLLYGVVDTPEYRAMNPNGTIPTLRDGDNPPVWETAAILRYLGDRYGAEDFWPRDSAARADVDKWAEWSKLNIALNFTVPVFWRVVRTPPSKRDPLAIDKALRTLDNYMAIAESELARQPFLAGATLTLADIQFGHVLFRYYDMDIARTDFPCIRRYYDALTRREAYREHVMLSYEELRETD